MSKSYLQFDTYKRIVSERLAESNIDVNGIAIPLKEGTKECYVDFTDANNRESIKDINQNYALYPVGELAFVDIDDRDKAPDKLLQHTTDTFAIESPHGQHRWILVPEEIPNVKRDWGEIRTENQYVVGPGSKLTDCDNGCCSDSSPGVYRIEKDNKIQNISGEQLSEWIGGFDNTDDREKTIIESISSPEIDSDKVEFADNVLSDLQRDSPEFFKDLIDRLNGGTGHMDLRREGRIDRSRQDFVTVQHLYGVFRHYDLSHSRSEELATTTYTHYCLESQYTKDGQPRKWVNRDSEYRNAIAKHAIKKYDRDEFRKLLNKSDYERAFNEEGEYVGRKWGEYGQITYNYAHFVIDWFIEQYDPEEAQEIAKLWDLDIDRSVLLDVYNTHMYYDTTPLNGGKKNTYPSPKEVRTVCSELDSRGEETYKTALQRHRREGKLKLAYLDGNHYVVYPADLPDPTEAQYIRFEGEKIEQNEQPAKAKTKVKI